VYQYYEGVIPFYSESDDVFWHL